jgi:hypothetical protein
MFTQTERHIDEIGAPTQRKLLSLPGRKKVNRTRQNTLTIDEVTL